MKGIRLGLGALVAVVAAGVSSTGKVETRGAGPAEHIWQIPWEPTEGIRLRCFVDRIAIGEGQGSRLTVLEGTRVIFSMDGETFIASLPYGLPPRRAEQLLLTEWSSGMSYMLVALRFSGHEAKTTGKLVFQDIDFALLDVDGDGISEIVTHQQVERERLPRAMWPMTPRIYGWDGTSFKLMTKPSSTDLKRCLGLRSPGPRQ